VNLQRETRWWCQFCNLTDVTTIAEPHSRSTPAVPTVSPCRSSRKASAAKWKSTNGDDYVGDELVTVDGHGRPVMNVVTTRDDGNDLAVFAPCARADLRGDH